MITKFKQVIPAPAGFRACFANSSEGKKQRRCDFSEPVYFFGLVDDKNDPDFHGRILPLIYDPDLGIFHYAGDHHNFTGLKEVEEGQPVDLAGGQ